MQDFEIGKIRLHLDLHTLLRRICAYKKEEMLSIEDCISLLESVIQNAGLKLTPGIEKKIDQSVQEASKNGLTLSDLLRIAELLG
jgi:hypothetical protein